MISPNGRQRPTGAFTGFTIDKKSNASLHAVLWAPSPASSKR